MIRRQRSSFLIVAALACALLSPSATDAQDERTRAASGFVEIGVDPAAVMTLPIGELLSIKGSDPCSRLLGASTSVNFGIGGRLGYVLHNDMITPGLRFRAIGLALGYDDLFSVFETSPNETYESYDPVNGLYHTVETRYAAEYTLAYLRAALEGEIAFGNNLMMRFGPSFSLPLSASVREHEEIVAPSNATFPERTQERTIAEGTGEIDDAGMRLGLGASLIYRLPLGRKLYFEPNIGVDFGLTKVQPNWSPLLVRGGIGIGYMFLPEPEIAAPPPARPVEVAVTEPGRPQESPFASEPRMAVAAARLPIEFRRQIVARYVPVLPTIFFDSNSARLPERYRTLAPAGSAPRGGEPVSFDELTLPSNAEQAHYQTLNIFASRLLRHPKARVTITGTTSRDESDRSTLAATRAQQVADYLMNVWKIEKSRITVRSRIDPAVPSSSESPQGREENRRVELDFSDDDVYRPIQLRSVEPITEPPSIPFTVSTTRPDDVARWEAKIVAGGATVETITGRGAPDGEIAWELENADRERVLSAGGASYSLTIYDKAGRSASTEAKRLPVRLDTTITVMSSADRPDNAAEFLLVTFDFDRAELTRRGRLELEAVLDRIGPASTVSIVGYTDPVGEVEHNKALALERARKVASSMPAGTKVEYRGASPDEAPYNSSSPEGRFLSRTVRVVVANPK